MASGSKEEFNKGYHFPKGLSSLWCVPLYNNFLKSLFSFGVFLFTTIFRRAFPLYNSFPLYFPSSIIPFTNFVFNPSLVLPDLPTLATNCFLVTSYPHSLIIDLELCSLQRCALSNPPLLTG